MRIISGDLKGRRFSPPAKNWPTRPTTDFAKEGLYNILTNLFDFRDCSMLDLFGGTGNHSYEFISRGAKEATYVEKHFACIQFVKKTATELKIDDRLKIVKKDVFKFLKNTDHKYDFIFADPPYSLNNLPRLPELVFKGDLLKMDGLFVLEHAASYDFSDHSNFMQCRKYGNVQFSFFTPDQK